MTRHLEMCDLIGAIVLDVLFSQSMACVQLNPGTDFFAHLRISNTEDLYFRYRRMLIKKLFDFSRVNIFTAADDHIFNTPDNFHIPTIIHGR